MKDILIWLKNSFGSKELWNSKAKYYGDVLQKFTIQGAINLYVMTNAYCASWILEVACGAGDPSIVLLTNFLRNGSSYFCCDFSEKMIEITWENINKSLLSHDSTFKHIEADISGKQNIDLLISPHSDYQKWCFSFVADNECLPFEKEQFDLYLAVLSLMLVSDYKAQIRESYWVLQ